MWPELDMTWIGMRDESFVYDYQPYQPWSKDIIDISIDVLVCEYTLKT